MKLCRTLGKLPVPAELQTDHEKDGKCQRHGGASQQLF